MADNTREGEQPTVAQPPKKGKPLTRRDFLKLTGAAGGALVVAGVAAATGLKPRPPAGELQGTETPGTLRVVTVKDIIQMSGADSAFSQSIQKLEKGVYGLETLQEDDWVVIVSKPNKGESVVVNLMGVAQAGAGKSKPKAGELGMHIQFQLKEDTSIDAIVPDALHPNADTVHRVNGSKDYFYPLSPSFEQNEHNFRGWAEVPFADGTQHPVMSIVGESPDTMFLYIPANGLKQAGYSPDIAKIFAHKSDLSFPALEP